jgi:hypothetical protein
MQALHLGVAEGSQWKIEGVKKGPEARESLHGLWPNKVGVGVLQAQEKQ